MRGKVFDGNTLSVCGGIIPAHAGKRDNYKTLYVMGWDHPRSCGEKGINRSYTDAITGSSPLMRGKVALPP